MVVKVELITLVAEPLSAATKTPLVAGLMNIQSGD